MALEEKTQKIIRLYDFSWMSPDQRISYLPYVKSLLNARAREENSNIYCENCKIYLPERSLLNKPNNLFYICPLCKDEISSIENQDRKSKGKFRLRFSQYVS